MDFEPEPRPAPIAERAHRIRLRHLSCFVVVAQERTLASAARRLHLSQPAVSKTLSDLERLAGERLVERGRHGATLTEAGERFLPHAVEVLRVHDEAVAALSEPEGAPAAVLRVGALPTVAGGVLASALARLRAERPHADIRVDTAANVELLDALKAGEIEIALGRMAEPSMMRGLAFELLYTEELVVVARPEHPLARTPRSSRISVPSLLDHPLIIPGPGTAPRQQADAFLRGHGITLPHGVTETQSIPVARTLTLTTDAVWVAPLRAVALDLERGWLGRLPVDLPGGSEPVGMLLRSRAELSDLAVALMEALRAQL